MQPALLQKLLVPVLAYAHNETWVRFGNPYSPHQLGTYPIGNATTKEQEPMPLENSGNMLFMLLGLARHAMDSDVSALGLHADHRHGVFFEKEARAEWRHPPLRFRRAAGQASALCLR